LAEFVMGTSDFWLIGILLKSFLKYHNEFY
jgi:hypothetical protein